MTTTSQDSFSYSLNLAGFDLSALRFSYPNASFKENDSVSLQYLKIDSGDPSDSGFTHFFNRVSGVDLQGDRASAATDAGLMLNQDILGVYPYNSNLFAYTLTPDALTISGSAVSSFSGKDITLKAGLQEINNKDGDVQIELEWLDGLGNWNKIGTISTTYYKESNADWQLISNSAGPNPPIIGFDGEIPLTDLTNGWFILNQPENQDDVGDFIADKFVTWSLSGEDAELLSIDALGNLTFKIVPDYENPIDKGNDNTYKINVIAENTTANSSIQPVQINIEDVDESCKLVVNDTEPALTLGNYCPDDGKWLKIDLVKALNGDLDNFDWVGVKIIDANGAVKDLGGLGNTYSESGELISETPLLIQLKPGESLQLVKLNSPNIGGEVVETVDFDEIDNNTFHATIGQDLVVGITEALNDPSTWVKDTLAIQKTPADGILDLRELNDSSSLKLNVTISGDCGALNEVGIVRLDVDPFTGEILQSVNGVLSTEGDAFRAAVKENIQGFDSNNPNIVGGGVYEADFSWTIDSGEEAVYALVVINASGDVYTFGTNTAADGKQHIKEVGENQFAFEDLADNQGSDWDYNDVVIKIS